MFFISSYYLRVMDVDDDFQGREKRRRKRVETPPKMMRKLLQEELRTTKKREKGAKDSLRYNEMKDRRIRGRIPAGEAEREKIRGEKGSVGEC